MTINKTLIEFFEKQEYWMEDISEDNSLIIDFLKGDISNKNSLAKELISSIIKKHNKEPLLICLTTLNEIEEQTKSAFLWLRDHYIHALNTFLLGIYVNHNFLNDRVNLFQWKLTSLFHDIAYPLELANNLIKPYLENMKEIKKKEGNSTKSDVRINFFNMYNLETKTNSFLLIQSKFKKWNLNVNAKKIYYDMNKDKKIDHGIFSGLTLLQLIESIYLKNNPERIKDYFPKKDSNWDWRIFEDHIVSSCSAIYLHNLKEFPESINKDMAPLTYLLKLCDELQDWERPKLDLPEGKPAKNYDIIASNEQLIFKVTNNKDREKIKEAVSCLHDDNVSITPFD